MGIEMLEEELAKIELRSLRAWTERILFAVDSNFWTAPSSSTGKNHPPEDNGVSGLVRHIKKGVAVIEEYGERAKFSKIEIFSSISGIILHDVCKNGIPWQDHTDHTHGFIASEWIKEFRYKDEMIKQEIVDAVRYHMAPWCYVVDPFADRMYTKQEMRDNFEEISRALLSPSRIELAVREGDYWASRNSMSFLPRLSSLDYFRIHDAPEKNGG